MSDDLISELRALPDRCDPNPEAVLDLLRRAADALEERLQWDARVMEDAQRLEREHSDRERALVAEIEALRHFCVEGVGTWPNADWSALFMSDGDTWRPPGARGAEIVTEGGKGDD